jgi:hypothetical protein
MGFRVFIETSDDGFIFLLRQSPALNSKWQVVTALAIRVVIEDDFFPGTQHTTAKPVSIIQSI